MSSSYTQHVSPDLQSVVPLKKKLDCVGAVGGLAMKTETFENARTQHCEEGDLQPVVPLSMLVFDTEPLRVKEENQGQVRVHEPVAR